MRANLTCPIFLVTRAGLALKTTLKLQNRTCTIELTHTPDTHEDGDGTPHQHTRVLAGSKWAAGNETDRAFWRELQAAEQAARRAKLAA